MAPDEAEELAEGAAERATFSQARTLRGHGREVIGVVDLQSDSRLEWTAIEPLTIRAAHPRRTFGSGRRSGRARLEAGTYRGLEVRSRGRWTVRVMPLEEEHEEHEE